MTTAATRPLSVKAPDAHERRAGSGHPRRQVPRRMIREVDDAAAAASLRPQARSMVEGLLRTLQARVGMESVYLSVLHHDHQHVLAAAGDGVVAGLAPGRRIPLAETYCVRMVAGELERSIGDTARHPAVAELPATRDGLSCWVGVPVHLASGQLFGSLCGASGVARADVPPSIVEEFALVADILGEQLDADGVIDETVMDVSRRVTGALTRDGAMSSVLQPIVDVRGGEVTGVEALARFADDDRPVGLWFADAERAGLLPELEARAVRLAVRRLQDVADDVHVAINVSPSVLPSRELQEVLHDAPLHRLVLEVTEHAAVADYTALSSVLAPLRARGLRLAVDDVGTGFAGLGHIVHLRPDIIKVDRSLVHRLADDPTHRAAGAGLVGMAEHVGATLVAEGVETRGVLRVVSELGFTHVQGYLIARPSPAPDLAAVRARAGAVLAEAAVSAA